MTKESPQNDQVTYIVAVILSLVLVFCVMKLWKADLSVPFEFSGDAIYYDTIVKGMMDNGWYFHNDYIGMPTGMDLYDFPEHDNLLYALLKSISFFSHNYAEAINLYFLLGFPLTTLISLKVFRHFKFSSATSLFGSLIYTFLPYHFMRGEHHLPLSSYYMVPPMVMLVLWVFCEKPLFWKRTENSGKIAFDMHFDSILALVICLLVSSNVYYAFFGCFFLFVAGLAKASRIKAVRPLVTAGFLISVVVLGLVLNLLPHFVYEQQHGINSSALVRSYGGPEKFGLKISQLLFPVTGHRIPFLRKGKEIYNDNVQYVNENDSATLGIIGSIGFLVLIAWIFIGDYFKRGSPEDLGTAELLSDFSLLNLSAIILSAIGGFAILFGLLVTPNIRGYNRISVYIAFFSIFVVVAILDWLRKRYAASGWSQAIFSAGLVLLLIIGILDQTTEGFVPRYEALKKELSDMATFVGTIESSLPHNAMVFQMPYVPFPESKTPYKMHDYDHFAGYLASKNLRWSYGAMKGREADDWQRSVSEKPLPEFLAELSSAHFSGIYIDRFGYADGGADLEARLIAALGTHPIISPDNRLLFFSLKTYIIK